MEQEQLFFEDWRAALRHLVRALGGFEAVGRELWPAKHDAGDRLLDCLTEGRRSKIDLDELKHLLRMGRNRGLHIGMHHLCDDLGYLQPATVEPLDQRAEVARQMDAAIDRFEALVSRAEGLRDTAQARPPVYRPRAVGTTS